MAACMTCIRYKFYLQILLSRRLIRLFMTKFVNKLINKLTVVCWIEGLAVACMIILCTKSRLMHSCVLQLARDEPFLAERVQTSKHVLSPV